MASPTAQRTALQWGIGLAWPWGRWARGWGSQSGPWTARRWGQCWDPATAAETGPRMARATASALPSGRQSGSRWARRWVRTAPNLACRSGRQSGRPWAKHWAQHLAAASEPRMEERWAPSLAVQLGRSSVDCSVPWSGKHLARGWAASWAPSLAVQLAQWWVDHLGTASVRRSGRHWAASSAPTSAVQLGRSSVGCSVPWSGKHLARGWAASWAPSLAVQSVTTLAERSGTASVRRSGRHWAASWAPTSAVQLGRSSVDCSVPWSGKHLARGWAASWAPSLAVQSVTTLAERSGTASVRRSGRHWAASWAPTSAVQLGQSSVDCSVPWSGKHLARGWAASWAPLMALQKVTTLAQHLGKATAPNLARRWAQYWAPMLAPRSAQKTVQQLAPCSAACWAPHWAQYWAPMLAPRSAQKTVQQLAPCSAARWAPHWAASWAPSWAPQTAHHWAPHWARWSALLRDARWASHWALEAPRSAPGWVRHWALPTALSTAVAMVETTAPPRAPYWASPWLPGAQVFHGVHVGVADEFGADAELWPVQFASCEELCGSAGRGEAQLHARLPRLETQAASEHAEAAVRVPAQLIEQPIVAAAVALVAELALRLAGGQRQLAGAGRACVGLLAGGPLGVVEDVQHLAGQAGEAAHERVVVVVVEALHRQAGDASAGAAGPLRGLRHGDQDAGVSAAELVRAVHAAAQRVRLITGCVLDGDVVASVLGQAVEAKIVDGKSVVRSARINEESPLLGVGPKRTEHRGRQLQSCLHLESARRSGATYAADAGAKVPRRPKKAMKRCMARLASATSLASSDFARFKRLPLENGAEREAVPSQLGRQLMGKGPGRRGARRLRFSCFGEILAY
eukprot:scaffold63_cov306-Pinguiococcus_pyrenoidosus.AAC.62